MLRQHPSHPHFSGLLRLLLLALFALLLCSWPREAHGQGMVLYDVDFSTPPHMVGAAPAVHGQNAPAPRDAPSDILGDPTVVLGVGNLGDQPCRLDASEQPYFDRLRFITGSSYPNGFEGLQFEQMHVELNVAVHQLGASSSFDLIIDDTYSISFIGGQILASGAPGSIGTYSIDTPVFVEVDIHTGMMTWSITLDGTPAWTGAITFSEMKYVRLNLSACDALDEVGVDDLMICGGGDCPSQLRILQHPQDQAVCTGQPAYFSVLAEGTPAPEYQWRFGGMDIGGATGSSYSIPSAQQADEGVYTVRVFNDADTLTSYPASLDVLMPVSISHQPVPGDTTICSGSAISYACAATGSPPIEYRWLKDGQLISGQTGATFIRSSVDTTDSGSYRAVAFNSCSSDTSATVDLNVTIGPWITLHPQSRDVCAGASVSFTATAAGDPVPDLQWRHNGLDLPGETGATLLLDPAQLDDIGDYSLQATNSCGAATSSVAALMVRPLQVVVPDDVTDIQSAIDLVCATGGIVTVHDGTWAGAGNRNLDLRGKQITLRSWSGNPEACIIDCEGVTRGLRCVSGEGAGTLIDGFTIRNGEANSGLGGAVLCQNSSPTFLNCIIRGSHAKAGGGMAGQGFGGTLDNCTFIGNAADSLGGGLFLAEDSEPMATANCTFYANGAVYGGQAASRPPTSCSRTRSSSSARGVPTSPART